MTGREKNIYSSEREIEHSKVVAIDTRYLSTDVSARVCLCIVGTAVKMGQFNL